MKKWFAAIAGSTALVLCGIVHGYWTDRWAPPVAVTQAAERLNAIPLQLGEWEGESIEVKPGEAGAGVAGCIRRRYVNRQTGAVISLFLVCGRPGPVSIHTPDVCYGASGFLVNTRGRFEAASGDTMWKADAVRSNATEETRLRLYWGWGDGSSWMAASDPRVQFVRRPLLYKLYVVRELNGANEPNKGEPCEEFFQLLTPVLRRELFDNTNRLITMF